jgi:mRNA interferase MazF
VTILKSGDIYNVNLDPAVGDEIQKIRPVVILNAGHKKHLKLAIVVPITGWNPAWDQNPFFVTLEPSAENGLNKKSAIDCFQIRAVSQKRFAKKIGCVSADEVHLIKASISLILDIEPEDCEV